MGFFFQFDETYNLSVQMSHLYKHISIHMYYIVQNIGPAITNVRECTFYKGTECCKCGTNVHMYMSL